MQEPGMFDMELVKTQLHYSGIMETIHIRKEGYPIRLHFHSFLLRLVTLIVFEASLSASFPQINCFSCPRSTHCFQFSKLLGWLAFFVERIHFTHWFLHAEVAIWYLSPPAVGKQLKSIDLTAPFTAHCQSSLTYGFIGKKTQRQHRTAFTIKVTVNANRSY